MNVRTTGGKSGIAFNRPKSPTKSNGKSNGRGTPKSAASGSGMGSLLPKERSTPIGSFEDAVTLLYGEKKIGKTSLVSQWDEPVFLMFEPGGKGLRIFQIPEREPGERKQKTMTWTDFCKVVRELEGTDRFRTVVVDTMDYAYDRAFKHVCRREGVDHPSEGGYGKVWNAIETEFTTMMLRLIETGRGIVFISHAEVGTFQEREGGEYNKIVPSMSKAARRFCAGIADIVMYYGYYGGQRYVTVQGSETLEAGHRLLENFIAKNGRPVHSIAMGQSPQEGHQNLVRAFGNEQPDSGKPKGKTGLSDTPAQMKSNRGSGGGGRR